MTPQRGHAHRGTRDANEGPIVDALEAVGATVCRLDEPLDLLVGFRGVNWLFEVKSPKPSKGRRTGHSFDLNPNQLTFWAWWRGQRDIVRSPDEALRLLGIRDLPEPPLDAA